MSFSSLVKGLPPRMRGGGLHPGVDDTSVLLPGYKPYC